MRPINSKNIRRGALLSDLNKLNAEIVLITEDKRKEFINAHEVECSGLRNALWQIGGMKCWYSEASLQECEGHVEHYRPKKGVAGVTHDGYWWRAFDWTNLRLAHPTVNRRKTDYLTGKIAGKGTYFPLRFEEKRANLPGEEVAEEPVLLDPVVASDTRLLCFSEESGAACPRYKKETNEWNNRRAEESIDYYHLNEASWNARRQDLMAEVKKLCGQLEELSNKQPKDEAAYSNKIDEIHRYINPFAEFSTACLQVVRERGLWEEFTTGL